MAPQPSENDQGSWNPALLPEDSQGTYPSASPESGLAIAHDSKETALTDAKSPQSDEDFSAWEMSDELSTAQPQYTNMDVMVNMSPGVDMPPSLDIPTIETQASDITSPVAVEHETASESAFVLEAMSSTNEQTVEHAPESVPAGSNDNKEEISEDQTATRNEAHNADTEDPWGLMEEETTTSLPSAEEVTPSTGIPLASSQPTIAAQLEENHEPKFVAETVLRPHEQIVASGSTSGGNNEVLSTTEDLPSSENAQANIQPETPDLQQNAVAEALSEASNELLPATEYLTSSENAQTSVEPEIVEVESAFEPIDDSFPSNEDLPLANNAQTNLRYDTVENQQDAVMEPSFGPSNDLSSTAENLPLFENAQARIQPQTVVHPTSAPNDVQLTQQPANPETPTDAQSPWAQEMSREVDSEDDSFFNQLNTQTKPIFSPPQAEARFEEGLPLLDQSPASTEPVQLEKSIADVFSNDGDGEDFFGSLGSQEKSQNVNEKLQENLHDSLQESLQENPQQDLQHAPQRTPQESLQGSLLETLQDKPHLRRKSTPQVLESFGFDIDSPVSDNSAAAQFDEILKDASSGPPAPAEPSEEELAARWEAELGDEPDDDLAARWEAALDDDDILLENNSIPPALELPVEQPPVQPARNGVPVELNSPFQAPHNRAQPLPVPGVYTPHQPSTADLLQGIPGTAPPTSAAMPSYFSQQPQNPVTTRGESFAERPKGGYKSPYDLPDDISRPRKPPVTHRPVPPAVTSMPPPPLPAAPGTLMPTPTTFQSTAAPPAVTAPPPAPKNFYEELPSAPPRSRPASSGRWRQALVHLYRRRRLTMPLLHQRSHNLCQSSPQTMFHCNLLNTWTLMPAWLRVLLPAHLLLRGIRPSRLACKPQRNPPRSRDTPLPPPPTSSPRARYASLPLNVPGHGLPFQPRTSSPLAHHEKVSYVPNPSQKPPSLEPAINLSPPRPQSSGFGNAPPSVPQYMNGPAGGIRRESTGSPVQASPPQSRYAPQEYIDEFAQRIAPPSNYASAPPAMATQTSPPPSDIQPGPLHRSQTQSPSRAMLSPRSSVQNIDTVQRPASVHGSGSPTKTVNPYAPVQAPSQTRVVTQHLEFIAPIDGQEQDPLERWKGAPLFKFGFGGSMLSSFPKHIPRYSAGQVAPMIKPSPGEIKTSQLSEYLPSADSLVQHPGPLKTKSKKKDLVAWLSSKIAAFENLGVPAFDQVHSDAHKRHEERILLWKVVKLLVENDGDLEGSAEVQKSLRHAIFPHLTAPQADGSYGNGFAASAGFSPMEIASQPDAVDPQCLEELRSSLIAGDREKAVWGAVDRRLWGHAMIIASTMDKSIWKQVTQEFVRREVRSKAGNTESLAALYEIFAGNIEESIDELVPPSARAGLQLINKADGHGSTKNVLDGLDKWKDTLGLVLSNRSSEDHQALLALGRLLTSYGRTEAAHVCFIFSRAAVFGGPDDPQANIVLLGADHQRCASSLMDEDAILLTEAYEYATSVLGNSPLGNMPHLLAFKTLNARCLIDRGCNSEAQSYCDAVAAALKASTRPSPYHHNYLYAEVEELSMRLRQTTSDNGSWISRPSMEKVSGSMWARFNSFVAGEESDAASNGSGKAGEATDFGPFANVAGTPTISRSPSVSDIYGSYPGAGAQPIPTSGGSKYHPSSQSQYAPHASPEQFKGRSSMDSQRSNPYFPPAGRRTSQEFSPSLDSQISQGPIYGSPNTSGYQPTPPQSSYVPLAPVEEALSPAEANPTTQPVVNGLFYQPPGQLGGSASESPYYQGPPGMPDSESPYAPPVATSSYEPLGGPMDMSSAQETEDQIAHEEQPKKKAFMDDDDDDDLAARAAAMQKAENDRKANEAFKKAAEEDAKRDASQQSGKKGWFGGWFGGKKDEAPTGGGPIRAKLGEESSFYYDQDLKKWVNKKDPNSAAPVRATPPPPRGSAPPSRTASSSSMPPNGAPPMAAGSRPPSSSSAAPPSFSSSPGISGLAPPPLPRSVSTGAAMPTPPGSSSGPPPRPSSSLTHASSIDDLLGAPTARKGNTVRGKKKGRYVDVMAQ
ncbi:uncharacterized protein N7511_006061 [Penicillium nucicola]|uniref:uncharacterized protein n=1 Tax=Penicillium nucicola TaxID=1850975 RepID=UPI002544D9AC|nr:uncharacterized protein N7511_006061 [Penicillium nucicola]KAJ5757367.1 hypothetical protein N7511_006061 [Penicillium nucicola]